MIFVTVGTEKYPFDRLIRAIDEAAARLPGEPVLVQAGQSRFVPQACRWERAYPYAEMEGYIAQARVVVAHAGVGSILLCLRHGKIPVVMARLRAFGEHVDDHQLQIAERMARMGCVLHARQPSELVSMVLEYEKRRTSLALPPSSRKDLVESLAKDFLSLGKRRAV